MSTKDIFKEYTDLKIEMYKNRGILKKEVRSYEVSLWTLQDDFITVLKWSDVEQKGRIEKPKITLNIDGTETFSCSIPMKIYLNGKLIDNPNWYNVSEGKLIEGMRKIKVILNKGTANKKVFEFLIVNVEEVHDSGILTCEITCENLAFHELGKLGYKINLSPENFQLEYDEWAKTSTGTPPIANIDYWCRLSGLEKYNSENSKSRLWYYLVDMNWGSFEKGFTQRDSHKIYEEAYVTEWTDDLKPINYNDYTEKARTVKIENSNLYNITLELAEVFGVFCRYEYVHDDNNHIIGRKIIFYNNFSGDESILDITYPYNSSSVKRIIDSKDLITKLFVLDAKNNNDTEDYSIMNAAPNASKEDYILNFDYLKKIGAITEEQYEAITPYEAEMRKYNEKLIRLLNNLSAYQLEKPKIEALKTFYENSLKVDQECINLNEALALALDAKDRAQDGYISLSESNPDIWTVTNKAIDLSNTNKGIDANSLFIYDSYDYGEYNFNLDSLITEYICEYDDSGNLIRISNIISNDGKVYAKYRYNPNLYYTSVAETWRRKYNSDEAALAELTELLNELEAHITDTETLIQELIKPLLEDGSKGLMVAAREEFELLMGPALREGYWQPDDYSDYGNVYNVTTNFGKNENLIADSDTGVLAGWDTELFDGEEKAYYQEGTELIDTNYVCINLSSVFGNLSLANIELYSLVFNNLYTGDTDEPNAIRHLSYYAVGASLKPAFIKQNDLIIPVLIFLESKNMTTDLLDYITTKSLGRARLSIVLELNGMITGQESSSKSIELAHWIKNVSSNLVIAYPRLKFSSLALKTDTTNLIIRYGDQKLDQYKDYYINMRNTMRQELDENNELVDNYYMEYFITIKPEILYKYGLTTDIFINYVLSNANTAIYLDAKKISLENAYPKVSYDVNVNAFLTNISKTLYNDLARIVSINDTDLKLENVFGYISLIELDLDDILNDRIEIKNYKNKFEDLFSKILAETEAMKYNSPAYDAAARGQVALNSDGLNNTLDNNLPILNQYFDNYFNTSEAVQERLASLFDEAGKILSSGGQTLNYLNNLTIENAGILNSFAEDISKSLTMEVFRLPNRPEVFKIGDIWILTDGTGELEIARYIATADSDTLLDNSGTNGFVRTRDGKLASITGAHIDINADAGVIDIAAENLLKLQSGGDLYVAADRNVDIVGGETINIGGTQINICAVKKREYNPIGGIWDYLKDEVNPLQDKLVAPTGINLIAGEYSNDNISNERISHIFIKPDKIDMAAAELEFKASSLLNFIASTRTTYNTSVVHISSKDGVWIGSGNAVRIFSGSVNINKEDGTAVTTVDGASVELNDKHLIIGFSSVNATGTNANVISMDKNLILLASGALVYSLANSTSQITTFSTNASASGVQILSLYIGMAVGTGNNRSIFALTPGEIKLGTFTAKTKTTEDPESYEGNFMWLSNNQIYLGGNGALTINTPNFKLQTKALESSTLSSNVRLASATSALLSKMGLVLGKGLDTSTPEPSLGFWRDSNDKRHLEIIADKINIGSGGDLTISAGGSLNITAGYSGSGQTNTGTINITSPNFVVQSNPTSGGDYFYVGGSGASAKYIKYTAGGVLEIKGNITADNGTFTGTINATTLNVGPRDGTMLMTYSSGSGLNIGDKLTFNGTTLSVTGDITARTLHVGPSGGEVMSYTSNGLDIGNGKLTFSGNSLTIKGNIYADNLLLKLGNTYSSALDSSGNILSSMIVLEDGTTKLSSIDITNGKIDLTSITKGTELNAVSNIQMDGSLIKLSSIVNGNKLNAVSSIEMDGNYIKLSSLSTGNNAGSYLGSNFTISPSGITISSAGALTINTTNFTLGANGDVSVTGEIHATSLHISDNGTDKTIDLIISAEAVWTKVKSATSETVLQLTDNSITLNGGNISLITGSSQGGNISLNGGNITLDGGSITLSSGASNILISSTAISISTGGTLTVNSAGLAINSAATGTTTALSCGNGFSVDAEGGVTLTKLYVAGSDTPINLSGNFSNAVSYSSGSWNGDTFTATLALFNSSITKAVDLSTSISLERAVIESPVPNGNGGDSVNGVTATIYVALYIHDEFSGWTKKTNVPIGCNNAYLKWYEEGETDAWNEAFLLHPYGSTQTVMLGYGEEKSIEVAGYEYNNTYTITFKAPADNSGNSGNGCFIAGTKVLLADNTTKSIEDIKVGTLIHAYDVLNKVFADGEVMEVLMRKHKNNLYDIYLSSGKVITLTNSHPLLTPQGWKSIDVKEAKTEHNVTTTQLLEKDELITETKEKVFIEKIIYRDDLKDTNVYNLQIEPYNTYIVENIVVHNDSDLA